MSNSSMVSYTRLSPNHYDGRAYGITKITPHYMAGDLSIETCGAVFAPTSRRASSNYGIGSDGRVGMYVEEKNAAWTSSNWDNDNRAITIECANRPDSSLSDACWQSLVNLCVDICRRNGIPRLIYTGGRDGNLTRHNMFADTSCPGPWLQARLPQLAEEVNARLAGDDDGEVERGIPVDGYFGPLTITALQSYLQSHGHPEVIVDGEISHQWPGNRQPACTAGWQFDYTQIGSICIRALQRELHVNDDGLLGPITVTELQKRLGTPVDGVLSRPSTAVRKLQENLNAGKLW